MMDESLGVIMQFLDGSELVMCTTDWFQLRDATLQLRPYQKPTLPVAVKMGIAATDALGVGLTLETPYWVSFAPLRLPNPNGRGDVVYPAGLYVPILAGGGIEYAVLQNLLVTLDARMGPTFVTANSTAVFTVVAKTGIAWRI